MQPVRRFKFDMMQNKKQASSFYPRRIGGGGNVRIGLLEAV
jgi:hypothetical protein